MCVGTEVRDADSEKRRHVTHEGQRATQADGRMKKEQSAGKKTKRYFNMVCVQMLLLRRYH